MKISKLQGGKFLYVLIIVLIPKKILIYRREHTAANAVTQWKINEVLWKNCILHEYDTKSENFLLCLHARVYPQK